MKSIYKYLLIWLVLLGVGAAVLVVDIGHMGDIVRAEAGETAVVMPIPNMVVVADTTATMGPELAALAAAWPNGDAAALDARYHLVEYKDDVNYLGNTTEAGTFQNWLDELTAAGGGECRDAMLQALAMVGRNAPNSRALVLSDAAPMGNRARLAFIINKLAQQDVSVYPVITDWCDEGELTEAAMFSLARLTGGFPYIVGGSDGPTATLAALDNMARLDTLIVDNNDVGGIKTYDLIVDSTATTLGVEDYECPRIWCLTCTLPIPHDGTMSMLNAAPQVQIRDPEGDLLQPGDPGVSLLQTASGVSYRIDVASVFTGTLSPTMTWQVRVTAGEDQDHVLHVSADSALHFDYLGRPVLRAGKSNPVRVSLMTDSGAPAIDKSSVQFGILAPNGSPVGQIDLFDDGAHGDGEADDGIYGGVIEPQPGIWYLVARGQLADGSPFRRIDPTPIRARSLRVGGPDDSEQTAGATVTQTFSISNDETASQTYELYVSSSQGWAVTDTVPLSISVPAGETAMIDVPLLIPDDAAPGAVEETSLTAADPQDISASDTAIVNTTVAGNVLYLPAVSRP